MVHCVNCGTELIPGKKFCHACGARVALTCPQCGAAIEPNFRFCPDCGFQFDDSANGPSLRHGGTLAVNPSAPIVADDRLARLAKHIPDALAAKIRASAGALAGERKLVTVLFCDLVGSTAIAERLDPEEYLDLLERYLQLAIAEIYGFEGIVNQLAGDGMMALFGAPIAHEDAPERAVRAALAIRAALDRLNQEMRAQQGLELRARVGVHTGPVVVGAIGNDYKMDYTATGDTTNLASRLQAHAAAGAILVSEATYRLVRGLFVFREVGPLTVKGKSEPVMAYEVLRAAAATAPIEIAVERGLTPLVGREPELAQLQACFERLSGNLAQVVAVLGQAGSGKSRLLYEFKRRLAGSGATFFEARCASLSQMTPYGPWISMLRQYFELAPDDQAACACAKIAEKVRSLDPQLDRIQPFLCHILSVADDRVGDLPADELKHETYEAVAKVVIGASQRAPVVMTIEDLHWIDGPSREMLELAVAQLGTQRVMLVVTHRPDYEPSWHTRAAFTQLNLHPLPDEETTAIIRALAGGPLPMELEQRILVKAEGNPFVTEEITRALIEEGYLVAENSHVRLTRPAAEIRMPDTVQELIGARLDRLGPRAKRVVQVAAVLGRQFHRAHVEKMLDGEGIDIGATLDELQRRGVIHRMSVLSKDEYRFGESLTQEVAYEGLLMRQRRRMHERIGALLEAEGGAPSTERSVLLAHHYARSDNRDKAIEALLHAARDAENVPSFGAAVEFYRQAWKLADARLQATPNADVRLRRMALDAAVGLCRVIVLYDSPDRDDVEHAARRGKELAEDLGDVGVLAALNTFHGMIMTHDRDRFAQGVSLVEKGLAVARQSGLDLTPVSISRALGWNYLLDGRFELAQRTLDWVVGELQEKDGGARPSDLQLSSRWMRDVVRYFSDDLDAALRGLVETHQFAAQAPNRTIQSSSAGTCGLIHFARANYAEAKRWADHGLAIAQAIGNLGSLYTATVVALATRVELGETVVVTGDADLIERGLAAGGNLLLNIAVITDTFLALGDLDRAERLARLAQEHAAGRLRQMLSAMAMGDVMQRLGQRRWDQARQWYDQAIDLAVALGSRSTQAAARLGMAEIAAARGDRTACTSALQEAFEICRSLGLARHQARAERLRTAIDAAPQLDGR